MKRRILRLKKNKSLYNIALDIGISEFSLYSYMNDYKKVGPKTIAKIRDYLNRGRRNYEGKSSW